MQKEKRLEKAGYYTQKGVFGSQFREDKKVKQLKGKSKNLSLNQSPDVVK